MDFGGNERRYSERILRSCAVAGIVLGAIAIASTSANGSVTIGNWTTSGAAIVTSTDNLGQTFLTPDAPNDGLTSFQFDMAGTPGDEFQVCIVEVSVGPNPWLITNLGSPVYTSSVQSTQTSFQTITFEPTNLSLAPDATYMFAFNDFEINGGNLAWSGDNAGTSSYVNGTRAIESGGPYPAGFYAFLGEGGPDVKFSATFDSVPEPGSAALLAAASVLLCGRRRRHS